MGSLLAPRPHAKAQRHSATRWVAAVEVTDIVLKSSAAKAQEFSAAGMTAHQVRVQSHTGFDFHWMGRSHYLALHDLHHLDAETFSDDAKVDRRRDMRDRMTFVPAGCRVWGWSIPASRPQNFTALYLDPRQMESEVAKKLSSLPDGSELYFTNAALRSTLEKLRRGLSSAVPADPLYLESLCLMGMLELCIFRRENLAAAARPAGRLAKSVELRLTDYVEAHLSREIGLNELAQVAGLSRYHFLRAFKRTTGRTPYQYLLEQRISRAQRLLKEGTMSVAEIAIDVGFKEATRLIRAFRKSTGVTPGLYRTS